MLLQLAPRSRLLGRLALRAGHAAGRRALSAGTPTSSGPRKPTLEMARAMPNRMCELSNDTLVVLAQQGHHSACGERLVRNVMAVDGVEYDIALQTTQKIREESNSVLWFATLPHQIGIAVAGGAAVASFPMVFHLPTVRLCNLWVTTDEPEKADLETVWEVGAWAWNWMEPPLGTASFVLLALQFMRAQALNMDVHPYSDRVRVHRAARLVRLYPQYDMDALEDFARSASLKPMWLRGKES